MSACLCVLVPVAIARAAVTITIDHTVTYQTIVGFGGQVNGGYSGFANDLMNDACVSVLRYDWCGGFDNKAFYDAATEKPVIVASCWSPPGNWKDNGSSTNGGHLLPAYYDDLADMAVNHLRSFKQTMGGVELYALSPQNEPQFATFYNSCIYTGADLIQVMKLMGQRIASAGLTTRIFLPEDMYAAWSANPYFPPLMQDPAAQAYVHALAFHGYTADGVTAAQMSAGTLSNMYRQTHGKGWELWQTENAGSFGMRYAWDVIGCLRYGKVSMYLKYGMIGDAPGLVGDVNEYYITGGRKTLTYYTAKTIHKFIRRGSVQLKSTSSDSATLSSFVAFRDPARNALAVTIVTGSQAQSVQLQGAGLPSTMELWVTNTNTNCVSQGSQSSSATFNIPANSVATLYGTGYSPVTAVQGPRAAAVTDADDDLLRGSVYRLDGRRLEQSASGRSLYHGVVIEGNLDAGTRDGLRAAQVSR